MMLIQDARQQMGTIARVCDRPGQSAPLLQCEYLVAENRILRSHLSATLRLSDPDRSTLAEIGNRLGRKYLAEGRNIVTGPGIIYSQASAQKNFRFKERWNLQFRFDFQNPFHNWGFNNPSNQVDFKNPQLFGKITADQTTASFGGQPLMNLMLKLSW